MEYKKASELYHHGILGQKWGKRNGPPYPLGSSDHSASEKKAGWRKSLDGETQSDRKIAKIKKKYDKQIAKTTARRDQMMLWREKNEKKIQDKYDKRIQKHEADRDSFEPIKDGLSDRSGKVVLTKEDVQEQINLFNDLAMKAKKEKSDKIEDFRNGTEFVKAGYDTYSKVIEKYRDVKIKAVDDEIFKNSPEYKKAVADYVIQKVSDLVYGVGGTELIYAQDAARKSGLYDKDQRGKSSANRNGAKTEQKRSAKPTELLKSESYNKAFLEYIKDDVVKPEMVDDPELMDLLIMEYEDKTGKNAMK